MEMVNKTHLEASEREATSQQPPRTTLDSKQGIISLVMFRK
jgi:hypothetical protein